MLNKYCLELVVQSDKLKSTADVCLIMFKFNVDFGEKRRKFYVSFRHILHVSVTTYGIDAMHTIQ